MSTTILHDSMLDAGSIVQIVNTQNVSMTTGTTVAPYDDTIPQVSEGISAGIDLAITPTNSSNILRIQAIVPCAHTTTTSSRTLALFNTDTHATNAIAVAEQFNEGAASTILSPVLDYRQVAGTTSSTTFTVRVGSGGAGTMTINGSAGARKYGGVLLASMTITEIAV